MRARILVALCFAQCFAVNVAVGQSGIRPIGSGTPATGLSDLSRVAQQRIPPAPDAESVMALSRKASELAQAPVQVVKDIPQSFSPRPISAPGPFQQDVIAASAAGAAGGAAFGSFAGPVGTGLGAAGGAVAGAATEVLEHHMKRRWEGGGLRNWNKPSRW